MQLRDEQPPPSQIPIETYSIEKNLLQAKSITSPMEGGKKETSHSFIHSNKRSYAVCFAQRVYRESSTLPYMNNEKCYPPNLFSRGEDRSERHQHCMFQVLDRQTYRDYSELSSARLFSRHHLLQSINHVQHSQKWSNQIKSSL